MVSTVLNFTIAANTSSAEAGAKRVGAAFNELGGASSTLAQRFEVTDTNANRVAKSLGVELSSAAERTVNKLEGLRDHLVRTGAPAADMQRVTEALAAADQKYAASLTVTTNRMGFWEANGTKIAQTAGVMGAAVMAFGVKSVEAFSESQKIMAQTDAVLKSTGGSAGVTKEQVLGLASALSKVTPFDDEVIQQGENLLLTFTNIGKDVFPRAIESALDLSTALGVDVVTASKMLGKALDQPSEGLGALSKATGKFTESEQKAIKEMVEMGNVTGAQTAILDKLDTKFKDSAKAAGETFAGQIAIARTESGNFMEDIGSGLTPALQDLAKTFPGVTAAAVGLHDAWGDLGISGGDLLIAIPLLKNAFVGFGATVSGMFATGGPIALAIIGIGALVGIVWSAVAAFNAYNEKQIATVQANVTAERATAALTKKAAEYGITLEKGNETQEQYNARLFQAIAAHDKLAPAVEKVDKVAKSHVITLSEQIEKQKLLVEKLKNTEGASDKLTQESAKLDAMLRKQSEGAAKLTKEHDALEKTYASVTGKIVLEIKSIEDDIKAMERHGGSTDALTEAKKRLGQKTLELIANQSGHKEILEKTTVVFQENTVHMLGNIDALEKLEMGWRAYIDQLHKGAVALLAIEFNPVISDVDTLNEAFKRIDEAIAAWEKMNKMMEIDTPEALKPAKQAFDEMGEQVSTIVTDLGKGIADALMHWKGFGETMKSIAREFGTGILRTLIETWFKPMEDALHKVADKISSVLSGAMSKISGSLGKLFSPDSILGGLASGGIMAGLGAGVSFLMDRLGRRGREKTSATGAAEELSSGFWEGTFKDVQSGSKSVDEGLKELNASWDKYVAFLNETLKDQTVIQRSIEGQRATLIEGTAALEAMRTKLATEQKQFKVDEAVKNLQTLGSEFMKTGEMSADFAAAITEAGGSVSAFNRLAGEAQRLQGLRDEFGNLRKMIDSLLPPIKTWQEQFFETGVITDEIAVKIKEAGGNLEAFKRFADMRQVKNEFASLVAEFETTGVATGRLIDLVKQYASPEMFAKFMQSLEVTSEVIQKQIKAAFDTTEDGIKKLLDSFALLENEWDKNKTVSAAAIAQIRKFADPVTLAAFEKLIVEAGKTGKSLSQLGMESKESAATISKAFASTSENIKNLQQDFKILQSRFEENGEVSDKLLSILKDYADPEALRGFQDLIDLAKESGISVLDLAKDSSVSADIIKKVFGSAAEAMDKEFTDAAKDLSTTLQKMDENLGKAIASLQSAMVTMIKDLIDVLLEVPGAAEKAARDANFFLGTIKDREVRVNIAVDTRGIDEAERRLGQLGAISGNIPGGVTPNPTSTATTSGGGSRTSRDSAYTPQYATGTDYVPRTGLAMVHQGEAIIPAGENRSGSMTLQFMGNIIANNPEEFFDGLERYLQTNRDGSRVRILKALKLAEPGKF